MAKTLENYVGKEFEFQVFPNSVKVFDGGKFCGLVAGVHRMDALQPGKKFEAFSILRQNGIHADASMADKFLVDGRNIYAFCGGRIMTLEEFKSQKN